MNGHALQRSLRSVTSMEFTTADLEALRLDLRAACINDRALAVRKLLGKFMKDFPRHTILSARDSHYDNCLYQAVIHKNRNVVKEFINYEGDAYFDFIEPLLLAGRYEDESETRREDPAPGADADDSLPNTLEATDDKPENPKRVTQAGESPPLKHRKKCDTTDVFLEMMNTMPDLALTVLNKYCVPLSEDGDMSPSSGSSKHHKKFEYDYLLLSFSPHMTSSSQKDQISYRKALNHNMLWCAHNADDLAVKNHPLVASLLYYKWLKARPLFYVIMCYKLLYTVIFTTYIMLYHQDQFLGRGASDVKHDSDSDSHTWYCYVIAGAGGLGLFGELVQLFARRWLYLSYNASHAVGTILAVSLYGCTLAFALPAEGTRKEYQWKIGVYIMFCSWFNLLLHHPVFGTYMIMMLDVIKDTMRFTVMYALFIVNFGLSFFALLRNQDAFYSWTSALRRTWTMMIGDIGYDDIYNPDEPEQQINNRGALVVLFYIFLFLSMIIMNMWTAFIINRMSEIEVRRPSERFHLQLQFILSLESFMPRCMRWMFVFDASKLGKRLQPVMQKSHCNTIKTIKPDDYKRGKKRDAFLRFIRVVLGDNISNHFEHAEMENFDHEDNRDILDKMQLRFDALESKQDRMLELIESLQKTLENQTAGSALR